MSLVTEDGTGLANAESLCSVATATAYHVARGLADASWRDLDTSVKEALLRKATDHMEQRYGARWRGYRMTEDQALSWPRGYVQRGDYAALTSVSAYLPDDEVPTLVANACAELALRANTTTLSPDLETFGQVLEETVGPITTKYAAGYRESIAFRAVDDMLARFLKPATSGAMRQLVRS